MTDLAKYIFDMAVDMNQMLAEQYRQEELNQMLAEQYRQEELNQMLAEQYRQEEPELPDCRHCGNWEPVSDPYGTGDTHIIHHLCSQELDPSECTAQDRRPAYDSGEVGDQLYDEKVGK